MATGIKKQAGTKKQAGLRLPTVLGSHMVMQRDQPVSIWGWAAAGGKVTVSLGDEKQTAVAGADGAWQVKLAARPAGGPVEIVVSSGRRKVVLSDVLFGDVWLCSGQSNMEFTLALVKDGKQEVAAAEHASIRLLQIARIMAVEPKDECTGVWQECKPVTAASFSGVGYFFGRRLQQELGVPIGLIDASWGGTTAEAWAPLTALEAVTELRPMAEFYRKMLSNQDGALDKARAMQKAWEAVAYLPDPGNKGVVRGWAGLGFGDGDWQKAELPGAWPMAIDGAVWYRREFEVPAAWAGKKLKLSLGAIDDFDVTYFNGEQVGTTGIERPDWWMAPREYEVPGKLVKAGRAVLAVRVFDRFMTGGFTGPATAMWIRPAADKDGAVALTGTWKFAIEYSMPHDRPTPPTPPVIPGDSPNAASVLYNGMLHGLRRMSLRGAIWYQGESNADRAAEYRALLPALIRSWRKIWDGSEFPFGIVQLANWMARQEQPGKSTWAELREAQAATARELPHCGLALAVDIGDAVDIHPTNKQEVGKRLALWALAKVYGRAGEYSGPVFESMATAGDTVRVKFAHAEGGLATQDGAAAAGFAVAGADGKFAWAEATIDGETVVLRSKQVARPTAVRYAWADNPACNLCNKAGLPAVPFRTDK